MHIFKGAQMEAAKALIQQLIPAHLHPHTYIAGGAAIAPHTAEDIDVWVLGEENTSKELRSAATDWGYAVNGEIALGYGGRVEYREWTDNVAAQGITLVGCITAPGLRPIQVLHAREINKDVMSLLIRFDISTHCWAVGLLSDLVFSLPESTLPSQLPRALTVVNPVHTLYRLRKILHRYGWPLDGHPDYPFLRRMAHQQGKETEFAVAMMSRPGHLLEKDVPF